jgi:DNA polymerase I-like protein with 3'-5' exonuclease and polymerase domains
MSIVKRGIIPSFEPGIFVSLDFSQIEIITRAMLTQDPALIQDIIDGVDFHCKKLAESKNLKYEDVYRMYKSGDKDVEKMRKAVKEVTFQSVFGARANSIARTTGMSVKDVKAIMEADDIMYPEVSKYFDSVVNHLNDNTEVIDGRLGGVFKNLTGRALWFEMSVNNYTGKFDWYMPHIFNYPVQSLAAEVMKIFMGIVRKNLHKSFCSQTIKMVNTVHDSLIFEIYNTEVRRGELLRIITDSHAELIPVLSKYCRCKWNVPISYELEWGYNWGEMNKLRSPTDLTTLPTYT